MPRCEPINNRWGQALWAKTLPESSKEISYDHLGGTVQMARGSLCLLHSQQGTFSLIIRFFMLVLWK
jgi:hypothetical protein